MSYLNDWPVARKQRKRLRKKKGLRIVIKAAPGSGKTTWAESLRGAIICGPTVALIRSKAEGRFSFFDRYNPPGQSWRVIGYKTVYSTYEQVINMSTLQLRRATVVFDEGHLLLSEDHYRPKLWEAYDWAMRYAKNVVVISATVRREAWEKAGFEFYEYVSGREHKVLFRPIVMKKDSDPNRGRGLIAQMQLLRTEVVPKYGRVMLLHQGKHEFKALEAINLLVEDTFIHYGTRSGTPCEGTAHYEPHPEACRLLIDGAREAESDWDILGVTSAVTVGIDLHLPIKAYGIDFISAGANSIAHPETVPQIVRYRGFEPQEEARVYGFMTPERHKEFLDDYPNRIWDDFETWRNKKLKGITEAYQVRKWSGYYGQLVWCHETTKNGFYKTLRDEYGVTVLPAVTLDKSRLPDQYRFQHKIRNFGDRAAFLLVNGAITPENLDDFVRFIVENGYEGVPPPELNLELFDKFVSDEFPTEAYYLKIGSDWREPLYWAVMYALHYGFDFGEDDASKITEAVSFMRKGSGLLNEKSPWESVVRTWARIRRYLLKSEYPLKVSDMRRHFSSMEGQGKGKLIGYGLKGDVPDSFSFMFSATVVSQEKGRKKDGAVVTVVKREALPRDPWTRRLLYERVKKRAKGERGTSFWYKLRRELEKLVDTEAPFYESLWQYLDSFEDGENVA